MDTQPSIDTGEAAAPKWDHNDPEGYEKRREAWLRRRAAHVAGGMEALDMLDRLAAARNVLLDEMNRRPKSAERWGLFNDCGGNLVDMRDILEFGDRPKPLLARAAKMLTRLERPNPDAHGRTCKHLVPADPQAEEGAV